MDLTTLGMLAFMGAAVAGIALGFLVGWVTVFELGLGVGLLLPGVVGLVFAARCLGEYREFTAPAPAAQRVRGEVVAIEGEPVRRAATSPGRCPSSGSPRTRAPNTRCAAPRPAP